MCVCVAAVIDNLLESKEVAGTLTGRQSGTAHFIPHIYSKAQCEWVTNFYKQNGYLGKTFGGPDFCSKKNRVIISQGQC